MCTTCGCGSDEVTIDGHPAHEHSHGTVHVHDHSHDAPHALDHPDGARHAHDHPDGVRHALDHPDGVRHAHDHPDSVRHAHDHPDGVRHAHDHPDGVRHAHDAGHPHAHGHAAADGHGHHHHDAPSGQARTISLERDVLARNQLLAERNRGWFSGREVFALNLMSSPGSGKTSILERTIRDLAGEIPIGVLEGDQATSSDADRIRATGAAVVQINTGTGCHLDAHMVAHGVQRLNLPRGSLLMIENVGNLVCPALFDLGESARVVVVSVTEGDDKPLKYPHMFRAGQLLLINKMDLLPYVRFDVAKCIDHARRINPEIEILTLSAETGEGMGDWYDWLRARRPVGGGPE
jgi:hydrogenase nickel incorporation protein HypB